MFAIFWIVVWALIFQIFNEPTTAQIWGFIIIGLGGPIGNFLIKILRD